MGSTISSDRSSEQDEFYGQLPLSMLFNDGFLSTSTSIPVFPGTSEDLHDSNNENFKHLRTTKKVVANAKMKSESMNTPEFPFGLTDYERETFTKLKYIYADSSKIKKNKPNECTVSDFKQLAGQSDTSFSPLENLATDVSEKLTRAVPVAEVAVADEIFDIRRKRLLMRIHLAYKRLRATNTSNAGENNYHFHRHQLVG